MFPQNYCHFAHRLMFKKKFDYHVLFTATLLTHANWTELGDVLHISLSYFKMPVTLLTH